MISDIPPPFDHTITPAEASELFSREVWVGVTWADVIAGDRTRLAGMTADVRETAPGTPGTVLIELLARAGTLTMPAAGGVDVLMSSSRLAEYTLRRAFPGSRRLNN